MIEPIFTPANAAAHPRLQETDPEVLTRARDRALLHRAVTLGIESAFRYGQDLPVGAVAAAGDIVVGRYFASDKRVGFRPAHAEYMAVQDAQMGRASGSGAPNPDTIVVSLEPCDNCQDFLATIPSIQRVGFGLTRQQVANAGLVRPHRETIFQRALRVGLPYTVVQIEDLQLMTAGQTLLDFVSRDPASEEVTVNRIGLQKALTSLSSQS